MDPSASVIRNANNVRFVFKRKDAGNETVTVNDAGISPEYFLLLIFRAFFFFY